MPSAEGMVKSTGSSTFGSVGRPSKGSGLAEGRESLNFPKGHKWQNKGVKNLHQLVFRLQRRSYFRPRG